jgi:hypothetical protein
MPLLTRHILAVVPECLWLSLRIFEASNELASSCLQTETDNLKKIGAIP